MSNRDRIAAVTAQLESLWADYDELFASFNAEDWQRQHGTDWTLADVPYHLAYFDHEVIAYPLAAGAELPEVDRIELDSIATLHRWNANQFARRSAYYEPAKAVARWQTTRNEMCSALEGWSDADLERQTWMALTMARGWRSAEYVLLVCLAHAWNEFMQLRYHAGRATPEPAPDVTRTSVGAFIQFFQSFLDLQAAGDRQFSVLWRITGPAGGSWLARIDAGEVAFSEEDAADADLTLTMSPLTFNLFWNGKLDLEKAVQSGDFGVSDLAAFATFGALFPPPDPDTALPIAF